MAFFIFITFLVIQRLSELVIAKRNEKWLRSQGAVEYGQSHYPFIVAMHTLFFISMIVEYLVLGPLSINWLFLILVVLVMAFKFWALSSLGKYWNTKIFRIPGVYPVKKGPYKFLTHPNYMEVILEIALIPWYFIYTTRLLSSLF